MGIPIGNDLVALFDPDADTVTLNPDYGSFSAGDPVAFNPLGSSALPSPLEADTTYYVVWVDPEYPHVAKLASTPGGDPIDLTESGDLLDGIECYYPEEWSDWSDGPIEAELDAADSIANTRGDGNHRTGLELLSWEAGGNPESDLPQDAQGHYFLTAARRLVQVRHNANHNGFTCLPEHVLDLLDANARLYL
jgi:hypothetical protein